jgi:hypothetical protein
MRTHHRRVPKIEGMRDLRAPTGTRRARYALAAVAVALLGLLSMHGWGSHAGAHSIGVTTRSSNTTVSAPANHGGPMPVAGKRDDFEQILPDRSFGAADDEPASESNPALLGLCLAVLASALLLGLAYVIAHRGVDVPRRRRPTWQPLLLIGRDRDPPDLHMLCVIRC